MLKESIFADGGGDDGDTLNNLTFELAVARLVVDSQEGAKLLEGLLIVLTEIFFASLSERGDSSNSVLLKNGNSVFDTVDKCCEESLNILLGNLGGASFKEVGIGSADVSADTGDGVLEGLTKGG